jgi:DNA-binding NarL/FixJ family response regulator
MNADAPSRRPLKSPPVNLVIVDDHELFRSGLAMMLEQHDLNVVGTASSGEEALEVVADRRPDVVLMDVNLPGISGVEATGRLAATHPEVRVVMLTIQVEEDVLIEAILAGASGYLLKDASIETIVAGVLSTTRGESLIAPEVAGKLLRRMRGRRGAGPSRPRLTEREQQVLALMIDGRDNAEIAGELFISQSTVKNHVASILAKLGVENRVQAVVRAVREWMS